MRFNLNGFHTLNIYQNALSFGYFLGVHKLMHTHIHDHYFFIKVQLIAMPCVRQKKGKKWKTPQNTHTQKTTTNNLPKNIYNNNNNWKIALEKFTKQESSRCHMRNANTIYLLIILSWLLMCVGDRVSLCKVILYKT